MWHKRHLALRGRVSCRDLALPVEGSDVAVAAGCQLHPLTRAHGCKEQLSGVTTPVRRAHPARATNPRTGGHRPKKRLFRQVSCKSLPVWYVGKFRSSQPALCMAWCTLVQMGNLSVSAGLRYSDMFSVDLPLFVSKVFTHKKGVDVRNKGIGQGHYLFGIDSVWHGATNELIVMMSFKMKHLVLFGVVRMIVGMLLGVQQDLHRAKSP